MPTGICSIDSLALWRCCCNLESVIFKLISKIFEYIHWNRSPINATRLRWWLVNIDSGDGLVPSGNNPSLVQIYVVIWWHRATMSYGTTLGTSWKCTSSSSRSRKYLWLSLYLSFCIYCIHDSSIKQIMHGYHISVSMLDEMILQLVEYW